MGDLIYGLGVIPNMPLLAAADISRALLNNWNRAARFFIVDRPGRVHYSA